MTSLLIPHAAGDLTPGWLTTVLRAAGVLDAGRVVDVARTAIGADSGLTSEVVRLRPAYTGAEPGAPASLVAKLASADPEVRLRQHRVGGNPAREAAFYRELAATVPVRTPRCLHAAVDEEDGWYALLLEDLGAARAGDDAGGCSTEDAAAALRAAARLHAAFWESPRLEGLNWLRRPAARRAEAGEGLRPVFARFVERLGAELSPSFVDLLGRIGEGMERGALRPTGPRTLVHGDFSPKNLFFLDGPAGPEPVVFDWALAAAASAARDLASLVLGLSPEQVRSEADGLLQMYHADLGAAGVRDYPFPRLRDDYHRALLERALGAVGLAGGVSEPGPARMATARRMLERAQIALEGFDSPALLVDAE
jgi:hypothetical protein